MVHQCLKCQQGCNHDFPVDVHPQHMDFVHGLSVREKLLYVSDCQRPLLLLAVWSSFTPKSFLQNYKPTKSAVCISADFLVRGRQHRRMNSHDF